MKKLISRSRARNLALASTILAAAALTGGTAEAKVTGVCSNCHTMHNSQDGSPMARVGTNPDRPLLADAQAALLKSDCLGCHGFGPNGVDSGLGSNIPQVLHSGSTDLAGGNFAYITGDKGTGASNAKGHNVAALTDNYNDVLTSPPGAYHGPNSTRFSILMMGSADPNQPFTCAGTNGCHGVRIAPIMDLKTAVGETQSLMGAHHAADATTLDGSTLGKSYRFLDGVAGRENNGAFPWQNYNAANHNEYSGAIFPILETEAANCSGCHSSNKTGVKPKNNTMSGYCATCHGDFHLLSGTGATTPFIRHPSDVILPAKTEYAAYTTFSVEAPVARPGIPTAISATVTPGTDIVMCLSCHAAHATDYADMLRWDYNDMLAHDSGAATGTGCFVCHTTKDDV